MRVCVCVCDNGNCCQRRLRKGKGRDAGGTVRLRLSLLVAPFIALRLRRACASLPDTVCASGGHCCIVTRPRPNGGPLFGLTVLSLSLSSSSLFSQLLVPAFASALFLSSLHIFSSRSGRAQSHPLGVGAMPRWMLSMSVGNHSGCSSFHRWPRALSAIAAKREGESGGERKRDIERAGRVCVCVCMYVYGVSQ